MNDTFHCADHEALVAYLYDEGPADQREATAAHVARCASCAEEIAALRGTRTLLAGWTPPEAALGFQITRVNERPEPTVLRPAAWWRRPLPAWAQAAAAALIFAAGLAAGSARSAAAPETTDASAAIASAPAAVTTAPASAPAASRQDLAQFEERLGAMEAQIATVSASPAPGRIDDAAVIQRVRALVAASEERQRRENATMILNVIRDFDLQREYDLQQVDQKLWEIEDTTGAAFSSLSRRVSFQQPGR